MNQEPPTQDTGEAKVTRRIVGSSAIAAIALMTGIAGAHAETLKIGFVGAQTGYLAPYDQPSLAGLELGLKEVNAAGGIGGNMAVELITRDMRSETSEAARAAQELVDEGVAILITPCDVDPSVAAGQIAQAAGIPAISSCASTPTLPAIVGDYMFSNYTADNLQAAVLANYAMEQGYKTALILLSRDTPYTHKLPEYFGQAFEKKGGSLVGTVEFKMGQQDFSAEITRIKELGTPPDVIMTSAYEPDFPAFIRQLRAAGITTPVLGSDGIDSPTTLALGEVAEGVVFSNAGFPTEGSPLAAFYDLYKAEHGAEPDTIFIATGYDLMKIIEAAVIAAGSTEGAALRDALDNLENVQGATGSITYKGMNRVPLRVVALNKIVGGAKTHVADVQPPAEDVPAPQ